MLEEKQVERTVELDADPDQVWAAVADSRVLGEWFGVEVIEHDLMPRGRLAVRTAEETLRRAIVEDIKPGELLKIRWLPIEELPDGSLHGIDPSEVEIRIEPTADGTRLTVTETRLYARALA